MFSTITILATGLIGLYWSAKTRNRFTRFCSLFLSAASILTVVPNNLVVKYAPYLLALACILAGFEPGSSRRIDNMHKVFFGLFGAIFAVIALDRVISWPFDLQLWPMVSLYFTLLTVLVLAGRKKIRTRLGALTVWTGMAIDHLFKVIW